MNVRKLHEATLQFFLASPVVFTGCGAEQGRRKKSGKCKTPKSGVDFGVLHLQIRDSIFSCTRS
jgi:hypothetical protein